MLRMGTSCSLGSTSKKPSPRIRSLHCSPVSFLRLLLIFFLIGGLPISARANLEEENWIFHWNKKDYSFKRQGERRGTPLICLDEIAKKLPLKIEYDPVRFSLKISKAKNQAQLSTHSNQILGSLLVAGKMMNFESHLSIKPVFLGARFCLPTEMGDRVLRPILDSFPPDSLPVKIPSKAGEIQVIIDAGHGGNDFGAHRQVSRTQHFREKDFVIQLAKELRAELGKLGVSAQLTREADHFLTLPERAEIANNSRAQFLISLHMNSSNNPKARGYEIFVLSLDQADANARSAVARENQFIPADLPGWLEKAIADLRAEANLESSLKWAESLNQALKTKFKASASKNVQMGPFYLLYAAAMPALLLELGYLTNPKDRALMLNPLSRKSMAEVLAKNIANQLKESAKTR